MPDCIGSDWELLIAVKNTLVANFDTIRGEENAHLTAVYGALADGSGADLLIPEATVFQVRQNADRLVNPGECPACFISPQIKRVDPVGPSSTLGQTNNTVTIYLYVTDRIKDDLAAVHDLTEEETLYQGLAYATAVATTLRRIGTGSIYTAGAGVIQPFLANQIERAYDSAADFDVTAIQIQQTWAISQMVRY